jgi:hypothetical protein
MNLRTIKKDVLFVTNEYLSDCITFSDYSAGKKDDKVQELINEALVLTDTTLEKINRYPAENVKAYFREITKEFYEGYDALYQKLSEITK